MILQPKSNGFLYTLLLVFCLGFSSKTTAQSCAGPYQYFESFRPASTRNTMGGGVNGTAGGEGWTFSNAAVTPALPGAGFPRTGLYVLSVGNAVNYNAITPALSNANVFNFYYRSKDATNNVTFSLEWSTDNFGSVAGTTSLTTTGST